MTIDWINFTPWTALVGGVLIGAAASLFVLLNGRIAGISGLLASLVESKAEGRSEKLLFLLGILFAPLLWMLLGSLPAMEFQANWVGLLMAGLLVGVGTRYGSGCTSGHGVCGISRLSPRSIVATLAFMAAGLVTVYVLRHLLGG
ncbi:YeeE/YedE family protein [Pseudomonas sp. FeN3W]|nr:YeeE/YedE family protein [Pseudomonas sp. FeN3W]